MKQNLTISLDRELVRKAKILAARRDTSISGLIAAQIEALISADNAYEAGRHQALELLDRGYYLGGAGSIKRADLYDRSGLRRYEYPGVRPRH